MVEVRRTGQGGAGNQLTARLEAIVAVNERRLGELERAQRDGVIPADFSPVELLSLIQSIASSWSSMNPPYRPTVRTAAAR